MATIKKIQPKRRDPFKNLPQCFIDYFLHGEENYSNDDDASLDLFLMRDAEREKMWQKNREYLLSEWVRKYVGSRPFAWWRWDSPEPRQRLGGVGDPRCEHYYFGVHDLYVWEGGPYKGVPVDLQNPPLYESESAYLRRHGLLQLGEARRLKAEDFEPVRVTDIFDFVEDEDEN